MLRRHPDEETVVLDKSSIVKRAVKILREEGMMIFAKRFLAYMKQNLKIFILPYALHRIKNFNRNQDYSLDELVDFAFNGLIGKLIIRPAQDEDEILELLRGLDEIKPKVVVEIGTAGGGTLFLFPHVASKDATIISIDLPGGKFGEGYPKWKIPLFKAFKLPSQKLYLIRADSHSQEILEKAKNILNGRKVDFLFIDGDHTYEGVKKDFEMYGPLVKESGIIAFHDIDVHSPETGCEVSKFWREIKGNYISKEIVKDWGQKGCGIGVLKVIK